MKKLTISVILLAIVSLSFALYFLISKFSPQTPVASESPQVSVSISQMPTSTQTALCQQNQLTGTLSSEGAAGSIYVTLELSNSGKTACEVVLGNTITTTLDAKNIELNQKQTVGSGNFNLAPGAKVYSQAHYPNGPQCQSGVTPKPVTFLYKSSQTSVSFTPNRQTGQVMIQTCSSQSEKTTVDIWPLSKTPINQ